MWSVIYGLGGCVCGLFGGVLCDKLGLRNFIVAVAGCAAVVASMLPIARFEAQVQVLCACMCVYAYMWYYGMYAVCKRVSMYTYIHKKRTETK
jgi:predicted MFS family arabinose efflux permease